MKTKLLTAISCLASYLSFSQTHSVADIDALVRGMRNQQASYQKTEKLNTVAGSCFVYSDNASLKIISVKGIEDGLEKNVEWYFVNGQLTYSETNWYESDTKHKTYSEKFYLSNNHLIAWMDADNQPEDAFSEVYRDTETKLVAYGEKIKNDAMK